MTDVIIIVLKADAVEDEVFDELGFMLVNVLLKMQDVSLDGQDAGCQFGWSCLQGWRILPMMLLKVVPQDDALVVCCIAFLQVDAVLKLLVDDMLQVVVQQEVVVLVLVVPWQVDACTGCQSLMLELLDRKELPNQVMLMSKVVTLLVKDAL